MVATYGDFDDSVSSVLSKKYVSTGIVAGEMSYPIRPGVKATVSPSFPYANRSITPVEIEYKYSKQIKAKAALAFPKDGSYTVTPKVAYSFGQHKAELKLSKGTPFAKYEFSHPTFTADITAEGDMKGLPLKGSASMAATDDIDVGLKFDFDAGRSGIKSYQLAARYFQPAYSTVIVYDVLKGWAVKGSYEKHGGKLACDLSMKSVCAGMDFPYPAKWGGDGTVRVLGKFTAKCGKAGECVKEGAISVVKDFEKVKVTVSAVFAQGKCPFAPACFGISISD